MCTFGYSVTQRKKEQERLHVRELCGEILGNEVMKQDIKLFFSSCNSIIFFLMVDQINSILKVKVFIGSSPVSTPMSGSLNECA